MINTGWHVYTRLIKVSADGKNTPLDEDNVPTSISGKPQDLKLNTNGEEGYIPREYNPTLCPLGQLNE